MEAETKAVAAAVALAAAAVAAAFAAVAAVFPRIVTAAAGFVEIDRGVV